MSTTESLTTLDLEGASGVDTELSSETQASPAAPAKDSSGNVIIRSDSLRTSMTESQKSEFAEKFGLNATLVSKQMLTPNLFVMRVKPDYDIPDFSPGQYVAIALPTDYPAAVHDSREEENSTPAGELAKGKLLKRTYSISSSPEQKDYIEFFVALVPGGSLTPRLVLLNDGDRLWMHKKITGTFTTESVQSGKSLIFVATGTGVAPFLSMLRTEAFWKQDYQVTLVYGARYPEDLCFRDELDALSSSGRHFRYFTTVSRPPAGYEGRTGYVQTLFEGKEIELSTEKSHIFLCGNPAMVEDLEEVLTHKGFTLHKRREPGNLHLEKYW